MNASFARVRVPRAFPEIATSATLTLAFWLAMHAHDRVGGGASLVTVGNPSIYELSRALGIVALLWSWLTTGLGMLIVARVRHLPRLRRHLVSLHRSASIAVLSLVFLHASILAANGIGDSLASSFLGFPSHVPGRPTVPLGLVAFYLALVIGPSYYLRKRLGRRAWRRTHRIAYLVYVLAVWHTFDIGSDVGHEGYLWWTLWVMQVPLLALFVKRITLRGRPVIRSKHSLLASPRHDSNDSAYNSVIS
jgi:predicted ferric reductase